MCAKSLHLALARGRRDMGPGALGQIRTGDPAVRNRMRYPLRHESGVGGERFELPQPKPLVYSQLVSPMNSPPLG